MDPRYFREDIAQKARRYLIDRAAANSKPVEMSEDSKLRMTIQTKIMKLSVQRKSKQEILKIPGIEKYECKLEGWIDYWMDGKGER